MWEFLKDIVIALFPSQGTGEPIHVFRWRQTTAITLIALGIALSVHIAWACGLLGSFGFTGFALAGDVQSQQQQLTSIRVAQMSSDIRDLRRGQCQAQLAGNQLALESIGRDLNAVADDYLKVTNRNPRIPACAEILVQPEKPR